MVDVQGRQDGPRIMCVWISHTVVPKLQVTTWLVREVHERECKDAP